MKVLDDMHKVARKHGLFMSAVCKEAGVSPAQLSRWRKGKVRPLYDSVMSLQEALGRLLNEQEEVAQPDTSQSPPQSLTPETALASWPPRQ